MSSLDKILKLINVGPSPHQAESSGSKLNQVGMSQSRQGRYGSKSSRVNHGPSRAAWPILSRPESSGADIEPSWPKPMSTRVSPCSCRVESFGFDMELSRLWPMLIQLKYQYFKTTNIVSWANIWLNCFPDLDKTNKNKWFSAEEPLYIPCWQNSNTLCFNHKDK